MRRRGNKTKDDQSRRDGGRDETSVLDLRQVSCVNETKGEVKRNDERDNEGMSGCRDEQRPR